MAYRNDSDPYGKRPAADGRKPQGNRRETVGNGKKYDDYRFDSGKNTGRGRNDDSRGSSSRSGNSDSRRRTTDSRVSYDNNRGNNSRKFSGEGFESRRWEDPRPARPIRREEAAYEERGASAQNDIPEENYILTGRNPIREALKNGRDLEKLLVQKGELSGSAMEIVKTAKERKVMVQVVEKSRLDEIAPRHQGLIAFASAFRYSTVEDMLQKAEELGEAPFLILLDGITDPHNLGAIIRSAECTGAHGIIVPQHRSVGLTPAAVKASAGAVEYIPIARVTNLNRTIEELQKKNVWVYALTMNGEDYEKVSFTGGCAVVIGAEGDGISKLTEEKCDVSVSLPMKGHLDSLNASVAAGVIMYRIMSARKKD